jgi:hypothetical protein
MPKLLAHILPAIITVFLLFNFLPQINSKSINSSILGENNEGRMHKVGLQVGHWKNRELPEELVKLRQNDGARIPGIKEWEVNYKIASFTAIKLLEHGIEVDILPATVPPNYTADLFLSIHADQHPTKDLSGYKFASPWHNKNKIGDSLVKILEEEYGKATGMKKDENNITLGMTRYYAFNYQRYVHSINPKTPAAIAEVGFLPNKDDQKIILDQPELAAEGLAKGVIKFLESMY